MGPLLGARAFCPPRRATKMVALPGRTQENEARFPPYRDEVPGVEGAEEGQSHTARRHGSNAGACRREKRRRVAVGEQQNVQFLLVQARPRACSCLSLCYDGTCCARSTITAKRLTTSSALPSASSCRVCCEYTTTRLAPASR